MKKKFMILLIILILAILIFNIFSKNKENVSDFKPLELDVGDSFTYLNYDIPMFVLNYMIRDVTGDGRNDMVMVIGEKANAIDEKVNNMDVVIYDTSGECFIKAGLKKCEGKSPKLMAANVNETASDEIILLTQNDDSTQNIKVITMMNHECKELMKPRDNKGLIVSGYFMDGFKAYLSIRKLKLETYLDLKGEKEKYINAGFFDADGRVLGENKNITVTPFVSTELIALNDRQGIKTVQRIIGFDYLDILDEIEVVWKYEDGSWNIKEAKGKKLGNLLY